MDNFVQTRVEKLRSVELVGFQGENLEDEPELFDQLKQTIGEIEKMKQYLVILPGIRPLVAVEFNALGDVPEGMTSFTIPEGEYVIFNFEKKYVGEFWSKICTEENQARYSIDLSKPRYEIFTPDLQPTETLAWYIPTKC
ncbi:GyrI-like domain-containing protein [Paenibacillus sp. sptzw28]|uniref:effector binding domain-containing protein n=1 Tax=Paenibacillus sp. sptzw28 TaxID=715179 RepID=UPI001C6E831B|nr:effector binding domain-containing protein [Paenibacillus sp. sptzw28]QYR20976.1 GyrI-like domain-containing protein [Paenibacillus sp. sptzw28]